MIKSLKSDPQQNAADISPLVSYRNSLPNPSNVPQVSLISRLQISPTMPTNLFSNLRIKPRMIIFDLDCTLWPFDCDDYYGQNLKRKDGRAFDQYGHVIEACPDSLKLLQDIHKEDGVYLACASKTIYPQAANNLVDVFGWRGLFDYTEIYPTSKTKHFNALKQKSGVPFTEMIFFDDLEWNLREARDLGIQAHLVRNGIHWNLVRNALLEYEQRHC